MNEQEIRADERKRIWDDLLTAILLDSGPFKIFSADQWTWLKKKLYPVTHEEK